jgi:integrase
MRGNITRRGKSSWRLKFDLERDNGERRIHYTTVRGTRKNAEAELARLLNDVHRGTHVAPDKVTIASYLRSWLDGQDDLAPTSIERYGDIIERQTIPFIGAIELQKLQPVHVRDWMVKLRKTGRKQQLSAQSVVCAHRVLRGALQEAVRLELLARNVADAAPPPKIEVGEVEILDATQIETVLEALKSDDRLYPIVALAIGTGIRRGELLALQWQDVDLERRVLSIERSLEQTRAGLRFKGPKSKHGKRTISLPPSVVDFAQQTPETPIGTSSPAWHG